MNDYRYFIGIGLPEKEDKLISHAKQSFHPSQKLTSPAHITLIPPFSSDNEKLLVDTLHKWANKQNKFEIQLSKVGSFIYRNYATVWLSPNKGENLKKLHRELVSMYPGTVRLDWKYIPHMTIAQNVEKDLLRLTKNQVRDMGIVIELVVDRICLYRKVDRGNWVKYLEFEFGI